MLFFFFKKKKNKQKIQKKSKRKVKTLYCIVILFFSLARFEKMSFCTFSAVRPIITFQRAHSWVQLNNDTFWSYFAGFVYVILQRHALNGWIELALYGCCIFSYSSDMLKWQQTTFLSRVIPGGIIIDAAVEKTSTTTQDKTSVISTIVSIIQMDRQLTILFPGDPEPWRPTSFGCKVSGKYLWNDRKTHQHHLHLLIPVNTVQSQPHYQPADLSGIIEVVNAQQFTASPACWPTICRL